jgi:tRNA(Arg) A34 adenosine deaminase TadA
MTETDLAHLRLAIQIAARARAHGNHPFGAVLADSSGKVLLEVENTVVTERDVTNHAETNLIRLATKQFTTEQLASYTMYASTEPCAMCAGATHWAGVGRVVFALSEIALYDIIGPSPEHLMLPCREVFARAGRAIEVIGPVPELDKEARAVHAGFWTA